MWNHPAYSIALCILNCSRLLSVHVRVIVHYRWKLPIYTVFNTSIFIHWPTIPLLQKFDHTMNLTWHVQIHTRTKLKSSHQPYIRILTWGIWKTPYHLLKSFLRQHSKLLCSTAACAISMAATSQLYTAVKSHKQWLFYYASTRIEAGVSTTLLYA